MAFQPCFRCFRFVEALSNYLGCPENSFQYLTTLDPSLSGGQVKNLRFWFRNPSSHQAMIAPGTMLSLEEGSPFAFSGDEPTHIRVRPFLRLVCKAWQENFDRTKIMARFHPEALPKSRAHVPLSGTSTAAPPAPSGHFVPRSTRKSEKG
jgi:hypothetical protein